MPLKIVRNDITQMHVDVIVNTANEAPVYSTGVDYAIYQAAGAEELLAEREKIGWMHEGDVAITPGFKLPAKYIIHAVSPCYYGGNFGEEERLRGCYSKSLQLALENGCKSIAFPLISTGNFGYPKEEGMAIAVDEISKFLLRHDMMVYLVVFDTASTELALRLQPGLDAYIDHHYVCEKREEEYGNPYFGSMTASFAEDDRYGAKAYERRRQEVERAVNFRGQEKLSTPVEKQIEAAKKEEIVRTETAKKKPFNIWKQEAIEPQEEMAEYPKISAPSQARHCVEDGYDDEFGFLDVDDSALKERMKHLSDTFQEYLFYLIQLKGLSNPEVYNRSLITKQTFSKIKNNPDYHPDKATAMRLCVGAKLSLDETKDLLARAGYALSPCDKRDIIFQFYIENEAYDMFAIDIALENHGLPCFI